MREAIFLWPRALPPSPGTVAGLAEGSWIAAEVAVRHHLHALCRSCDLPHFLLIALFQNASFPLAAILMSRPKNWKSIIRLHIAVASSERHAEARHAPVQVFFIAQAESLSKPVSVAAGTEIKPLRYAFANEHGFVVVYPIRPRRPMLTLLLVLFGGTRVRYHALFLLGLRIHDKFVDVVLAATLEVLEGPPEKRRELGAAVGVHGRRRSVARRACEGVGHVSGVVVEL